MLNKTKKILENIGAYSSMLGQMIVSSALSPPPYRLIREQLFEVVVMSLPVIAITGLSTGMVLAAQAFFQLADKGLASTTGIMVTKSMLVELGPILTAFMITGRIGAAITAEIGTMKVSEQIDALRSMAVDPLSYLITPRFIAMTTMLPVLTAFSCAMGIFGGYLIAVQLYGMPEHNFFDPIPDYMSWYDIFSSFIKSAVFGFLIVSICSFKGLQTKGGASGVGRATTNSVVISYAAILLANFILTLFLNSFYWTFLGV